MVNIVLLGPPGSGKGTQAEMIGSEYGWPQISTGNILRHAIEEGSDLGKKAKSYMDEGELVPDDLVDEIVKQRLGKPDCEGGYLLDGFPRDVHQAKALDSFSKIKLVIDIQVPDEQIISRLSGRRVCDCGQTYHIQFNPPKGEGVCDLCGKKLIHREDDQPDTISHRLEVYHRKTEPLIEFYRGHGVLEVVDGTKHIDDIFEAIKSKIDKL